MSNSLASRIRRFDKKEIEGLNLFNRNSRHHYLVLLGYLLVAAYLVAPVMGSLSTRFVGGNSGDVYEMARHIWWFKSALQNGDDLWYQDLLAYPDGFVAVIYWANPLQFFPMWLFAFVMPLALAYNLGILLTLTLNGWAMYFFARHSVSRRHPVPALFAGLIFQIFPIFQGHLFAGHAGLLVQWPVPLLLHFLFNYVQVGGWRRFALALLFYLLAAMGHTLQVIYLLAPLSGLFLFVRLYRRDYVGAARLLLVAGTGGIVLLLFLLPIFSETLATPRYTEAGGHVRYSIDLLGLVSPSFQNPFWRDIASHSARVLGVNLGEGASYIGVIGGLLALIGLVFRKETRWWLLVAMVSWLLALGPVPKVFDQALTGSVAGYAAVIPLPFAFVMNLPLVELARTPGRFMFLFAAAFAIIAGYGMSVLWSSKLFQRRGTVLRYSMTIALALLLFHDYQFFGVFPSVTAEIPAAIHALKDRRDIEAIYNVPFDDLQAAKEAMYLQTAHGKPLIAGHDTRSTPVDPALLTLLSTFRPSLLSEAGVDVVILNKARARETGEYGEIYGRARANLGPPAYEDDRYALFEVRQTRSSAVEDWVDATHSDGQSHVTYIYKDEPGWMQFRGTLRAENRRVQLFLNDVPLQRMNIVGEEALALPIPIARRGYHTLRIALDPPCPEQFDTAVLLCHVVTLEDFKLELLNSGPIYDPVRIADGIELSAYHMSEDFAEAPVIRFWWSFDAPRSGNDVRFIHVLDELRGLGDQNDTPVGVVSAGSALLETVRLDGVLDLPAGAYTVLTGWYSLPEMVRYDVLTNVEGAQDSTIVLGTFTVEA